MAVADGVGPSTALWLQAGSELGFRNADPNGPQTESFAALAETKANGRRVSSYTAFILPIEKSRVKLKIIRYATASNILVDEQKKAFGVRYYRHGIPQIAHATKEVIISAGAFASPLLLMMSGIGPKDLLNEAKIPVVADLPVGIGLQDHATVRLRGFRINDTSLFPTIGSSWTSSSIDHYLNKNGTGILNAALGGQMFMASSRAKRDLQPNWPDIHILLKPDVFNPQPETPQEIFFDVVLGRPKSRGYISLNTSAYLDGERDAEKLSVIDYRLLEDETDIDVLIEGIKMALKIAENTTAFQRIGTRYTVEQHKNCVRHKFRSDEYWRCLVGQLGAPWFHLAGSCRMGYGPRDKFAVVDSKLRVLEVTNLRVIDGSIMPLTPNANTAAPITMIGEKGSAMISETWESS